MKLKITIIMIILFISGCKIADMVQLKGKRPDNGKIYTEDSANLTGVIVEIPKLAKLSPDELNQELGQPKQEQGGGSRITRFYDINGGEAELIVIMENSKIIDLELRLNTLRETSDDLLKAGGFDLQGQKADWENAITKIYNNRSFNGIRFESISPVMSPPKQKWERIEAQIAR